MKQAIKIIFFISVIHANLLFAQDTITCTNGTILYGKILENEGHNIIFKTSNTNSKGQAINNSSNSINQNSTKSDCENKDIGEIEFVNQTEDKWEIDLYAVGTNPDASGSNPIVLTLIVPPKSSISAYEIISGVHYVYLQGFNRKLEGQIKVAKCQTYSYTIK